MPALWTTAAARTPDEVSRRGVARARGRAHLPLAADAGARSARRRRGQRARANGSVPGRGGLARLQRLCADLGRRPQRVRARPRGQWPQPPRGQPKRGQRARGMLLPRRDRGGGRSGSDAASRRQAERRLPMRLGGARRLAYFPRLWARKSWPSSRARFVASSTALIERGAQSARLQRVEAGDGGPSRAGHLVLELARVGAGLDLQAGAAEHGLGRELQGGVARQADLDPGVRERLDDEEHVGRPAPRQPGHRVDERLLHRYGEPDGVEERLGQGHVQLGRVLAGGDGGGAGAHQGRRVGHGAHDARAAPQLVLDGGDGHAGRDGDDELLRVDGGGDLVQGLVHRLRLDREDRSPRRPSPRRSCPSRPGPRSSTGSARADRRACRSWRCRPCPRTRSG